MGIYYHSTRDKNKRYSASEAILKGLAPDGGLFVPSEFPQMSDKLGDLAKLGYADLCLKASFMSRAINVFVSKSSIHFLYLAGSSFLLSIIKTVESILEPPPRYKKETSK